MGRVNIIDLLSALLLLVEGLAGLEYDDGESVTHGFFKDSWGKALEELSCFGKALNLLGDVKPCSCVVGDNTALVLGSDDFKRMGNRCSYHS